MIVQVLNSDWTSEVKRLALDVVCQYAEFLGIHIEKPNFRVYDNRELYIPTEVIRKF